MPAIDDLNSLVDTFWTRYFEKYNIPAYMHSALRRYIEKGVPPGDFLQAVIKNNLKEAVFRADSTNLDALPNYVKFFYNEAPAECWGSEDKYTQWTATGGTQR